VGVVPAAVLFTFGTPNLDEMSQLATLYYVVPVNATQEGAAYNPTGDTVQFAFMAQATQVPQNSDWVAGSWDTVTSNLLYPYAVKCLVGPSGVINPGVGRWLVYAKITDSPQVDVQETGYLQIS
jgi:hypothetical protein